MPDPKLANWRSKAAIETERAARAEAQQKRRDDVAQGVADPQTLEEVVVRLKALEAKLENRT